MTETGDQIPAVPSRFRHDAKAMIVWRLQLPHVEFGFLPPSTFRPNPLPVGNRLYASIFSPGAVVAIDRRSGALVWRRPLRPFGGSQVLFAGRTLYAKTAHTLYALDPTNGSIRWEFCPYGIDSEEIYSAPSVMHRRLFIGDRRGYLHAIDTRSGRLLWSVLTSSAKNNDVNGPPLLFRGRVVVATNAGRALALDPSTGAVIWSQRIAQPSTTEIAVDRGRLLVVTWNSLWWLDGASGAVLARRSFPRRWIVMHASKGRRTVLALGEREGSGRELVGLSGMNLVFRRTWDQGDIRTLRWLPSGLLVETRAGGIGILSPPSGMRIHDIRLDGWDHAAQPAERDGRLYILTDSGAVLSLRWPPRS